MKPVELPPHLRGVFFDWHWETVKVWSLPTPASSRLFRELEWHLGLRVWSTAKGESRFDLAPATVLADPSHYPRHWRSIQAADLSYPLELFRNSERWVILDGYHRLASHSLQRSDRVPVRLHPDEYRDLIQP
jgi:hypothetical protein